MSTVQTALQMQAHLDSLIKVHGNGPIWWLNPETGERHAVMLQPAIARDGIYFALQPLDLPVKVEES